MDTKQNGVVMVILYIRLRTSIKTYSVKFNKEFNIKRNNLFKLTLFHKNYSFKLKTKYITDCKIGKIGIRNIGKKIGKI